MAKPIQNLELPQMSAEKFRQGTWVAAATAIIAVLLVIVDKFT